MVSCCCLRNLSFYAIRLLLERKEFKACAKDRKKDDAFHSLILYLVAS